jgi:hypothetical protein
MMNYRVTLKKIADGSIKKIWWLSYSEEDAKREATIAHPGYEAISAEQRDHV